MLYFRLMALVRLILLLIFTGVAFSSPIRARSQYSVKESHSVPGDWVPVGAAASTHKIHLQIALRQQRFDKLERHLYEGKP